MVFISIEDACGQTDTITIYNKNGVWEKVEPTCEKCPNGGKVSPGVDRVYIQGDERWDLESHTRFTELGEPDWWRGTYNYCSDHTLCPHPDPPCGSPNECADAGINNWFFEYYEYRCK